MAVRTLGVVIYSINAGALTFGRMKSELEKQQAEHNEEISQLQQKYKLEIESLKDQLLEAEARRESLEIEVRLVIQLCRIRVSCSISCSCS